MKKLLFICIGLMAVTAAFSQDDTYYSDTTNITDKSQTAPPDMPDYVQPPCPEDGYLWQPGYWAWGWAGYYWVPGVWVAPPSAGLLWTPGWWGFYGGWYGWHPGFWGPHVGFYGGVNYGFGYGGVGFYGGRWDGGVFHYNTNAWHVNAAVVHHTYASSEGLHGHAGGHSFTGPNGVHARPADAERAAMHENHVAPTNEQVAHHQAAGTDKRQFVTGTARPSTSSMNRTNGQHFDHMGHSAPAFRGGGGAPRGGGGGGRGRR
jgi:hypothetical protein